MPRRPAPATLARVSAPSSPSTPAAITIDWKRVSALAERLCALGVGVAASVCLDPSGGATTDPEKFHRLEALASSGAAGRAREAYRLLLALDAEHRPAARWLAADVPASLDAARWPALLARAVGPRELSVEVDRCAELVRATRGAAAIARARARGRLTATEARDINVTNAAMQAATEAYARAVKALDAWGRLRLVALVAAVDALDERKRRDERRRNLDVDALLEAVAELNVDNLLADVARLDTA